MRTILGVFVLLSSATAQPVVAVQMNESVDAWKATAAYTIAVAAAMPAESYSFKPTPDEFSFADQMLHISHANYAWFAGVVGEKRSIADGGRPRPPFWPICARRSTIASGLWAGSLQRN